MSDPTSASAPLVYIYVRASGYVHGERKVEGVWQRTPCYGRVPRATWQSGRLLHEVAGIWSLDVSFETTKI